MLTFLAFAIVFLFIGLIYVIVSLMVIPGMAEERLGRFRRSGELPNDADHWRDDADSPAGRAARGEGLRRQTRLWIDADRDWLGRERILRQVRYVDEQEQVIRTEPDRRIKRRHLGS